MPAPYPQDRLKAAGTPSDTGARLRGVHAQRNAHRRDPARGAGGPDRRLPGHEHALAKDETLIGRNPTTDITLLDEGISREHALILRDEATASRSRTCNRPTGPR